MVMLGLVIYLLIGICAAIVYCASEYKNYKKYNSRNWDTYYEEHNLKEWSVIIILGWPILVISMIPYLLAQIPRIVIKKYFDD